MDQHDITVRTPIEMRVPGDSAARVALELMQFIGPREQKEQPALKQDRQYWLELYAACLKPALQGSHP